MREFRFIRQSEKADCGATCLGMVANYYDINFSWTNIRNICRITDEGSTALDLCKAANSIGLTTKAVRITLQGLLNQPKIPFIVHIDDNHYVVVIRTFKNRIKIADPAYGIVNLTKADFIERWIKPKDGGKGVVIFLIPARDNVKNNIFKQLYTWFGKTMLVSPGLIVLLALRGLILGLIPLIFKKSLDAFIANGRHFTNNIFLLLAIIIVTLLLKSVWEFITDRILVIKGANQTHNALVKLIRNAFDTPLHFIDGKLNRSVYRNISDIKRRQLYLTTDKIKSYYLVSNLLVLSAVLLFLSFELFIAYLVVILINLITQLALRKRQNYLDYKLFHIMSKKNASNAEIVDFLKEIKLYGMEGYKFSSWLNAQREILKVRKNKLVLERLISAVLKGLSEFRSIVLLCFALLLFAANSITFGDLGAISFCILWLSVYLNQVLDKARSTNAQVDFTGQNLFVSPQKSDLTGFRTTDFADKDIDFNNITISAPNSLGNVFKNYSLKVPGGRTTVIYGKPGSGKTVLVELLLKSVISVTGSVTIGKVNLLNVNTRKFYSKCGVVLEDTRLFSDTIVRNIVLGEAKIDVEKLEMACSKVNVKDFIKNLPSGFDTKIGNGGLEISSAVRTKILLARVFYQNPEIIILDCIFHLLEDDKKIILDNIREMFLGHTVIITTRSLDLFQNVSIVTLSP